MILQALRRPGAPALRLEPPPLRPPEDLPRGSGSGGCGIGGVRLLRGPFKWAQERAGRHLLELPIDLLLDDWQLRAGYRADEPSVQRVGHYLSACSLMWAATGEAVFRRRAEHVVRRLTAWLRATGFGATRTLGPLRTSLEDARLHVGSGLACELLRGLGFAGPEDRSGVTAWSLGAPGTNVPVERVERAEQVLVNTVLAASSGCMFPFDGPPAVATPALPAGVGESIFAVEGDVLCVAQYIAAELTWREKALRVSQVTAFPERRAVRLIVGAAHATALTLRLRHPSWCRAMTVRLNGEPLIESREAGRWVDLSRHWCNGDVVDLELPMHLRLVPAFPGAGAAMLLYGPMALVAADEGDPGRPRECQPMPRLALRGRVLEDAVRRLGSTLGFRAAAPFEGGTLDLLPCHQAPGHRGLHFELT